MTVDTVTPEIPTVIQLIHTKFSLKKTYKQLRNNKEQVFQSYDPLPTGLF